MSQERESTMLGYARFHGLSYNYLLDDPLANLKQPDGFLQQFGGTLDDLDNSELNNGHLDEKLSFGKESISLLAAITVPAKQSLYFDEDQDIDPHRFQKLKQELPMLRTDHELDMRNFAPQIVPNLVDEFLPLERVDEEADEGLKWPVKYSTLPEEFASKFQSERLQVPVDVLVYLKNTLKLNDEDGNFELQDDQVLTYRRNAAADPVTPPLLPLSPPLQPFLPSSDAGNLEFLSDHTSPTRQEIYDADQLLFEGDAIVPQKRKFENISEDSDPMLLNVATVESFYSPLKGLQNPPSSPNVKRVSLLERKIEGPLTPLTIERPLPWETKGIPFNDAFRNIIPQLPLPIPKSDGISSDDIDTFFAQSIEPVATKAERGIEQEQLVEADTTRRVSVPIMDFSLPKAPWKGLFDKNGDKEILQGLKKTHLSENIWPANGKSERELSWVPFPASIGRSDIRDDISDLEIESKYLTQPERIDSSTLVWKPEGLRILDDLASSEDEDFEYGSFKEAKDLNYLVRKRALEIEEEEREARPRASGKEERAVVAEGERSMDPSGVQDHLRDLLQVNIRQNNLTRPSISDDLASEPFSAMTSLDKFICIRKGETYQSKQIANPLVPIKEKAIMSQRTTQGKKSVTKLGGEQDRWSEAIPSLPMPQITIPNISHSFIVSASFLRNRKLARRVQDLYSAAEFIERDFTLYSSTRSVPPLDTKLSPDADTMADEADMIVSPSTGLILTTLQKIKQRALPGQNAQLRVHEKVLRAAPRYERLLVMITEDNNGEAIKDKENGTSSNLTNSDWEALADFMGFCSTLRDDTQGLFIAGGEEQQAQWIVAMMVKYGMADPQAKLLQDETLWEIFLRRAGLNAFAAQCILAELKAPDQNNHDPQGNVDFGLVAFIKMPLKERLARFEGLFGGRSLLIRVSRRLDARW